MPNEDINIRSAKYSFLVLGILVLLGALTLSGISLAGFEVPSKLLGLIVIGVVVVNISEIGFKKLTKISRLKKLGTQQLVNSSISLLALLGAVGLITGFNVSFLTGFANGILYAQGLFLIIEAYR